MFNEITNQAENPDNTDSTEDNNSYGYPDWKDGTQYPYNVKTSIRDWKWEFIRRDAEYISAWEGYNTEYESILKLNEPDKIENLKKLKARLCRKFRLNTLDCPYFGDLQHMFTRVGDHQKVVPIDCSEHMVMHFVLKEKYKGNYLISINPNHQLDEQWKRAKKELKEWEFELHNPNYRDEFDCPIAREEEEINVALEEPLETKETRIRPYNFDKYLRILDARSKPHPEGASWNQLANHFDETPSVVRRWYDKAKETQKKARNW